MHWQVCNYVGIAHVGLFCDEDVNFNHLTWTVSATPLIGALLMVCYWSAFLLVVVTPTPIPSHG